MKNSKICLVTSIAFMVAISGISSVPTFAGTGGSDYAGILYGQDATYCDSQAVSLTKTDATNGMPLGGAVFSIKNTSAYSAGILTSSAPLDAAAVAANRIKWQNAFDTSLDNQFTANSYGAIWKAAEIKYSETRKPSTASDTDPTTYTSTEIVYYPANITGETDPLAQSTAMYAWPNMAAAADGSTVTVSDFFATLKTRLDNIGNAVYSDYNAAAPAAGSTLTVRPALKSSQSEADATSQYTKAYSEYFRIMGLLKFAGYPNATFTGTTISFGAFSKASQNWAGFVNYYNLLTTKGNYSFGLKPPTYDLMYSTLGVSAEITAENAGNAAVGATTVAGSSSITAPPTGPDGKVYYQVFGRTVTKATVGTLTNTMDRTCNHLLVSVTETKAPNGYKIDNTAAVVVSPAAAEDAISNYSWTDSLNGTSSTKDTPTIPTFESGK